LHDSLEWGDKIVERFQAALADPVVRAHRDVLGPARAQLDASTADWEARPHATGTVQHETEPVHDALMFELRSKLPPLEYKVRELVSGNVVRDQLERLGAGQEEVLEGFL
jgi:hypothetical protein